MLEMGDVLKTWSLPQPPLKGVEMDAEALPDHRLAYLDYEGPISGDRGSVTRWDRGTYEVECQSESELIVRLSGEKLMGKRSLRQSAGETKTAGILLSSHKAATVGRASCWRGS